MVGLGAFACGDDPVLQGPPTPNGAEDGGAPDGTAPISNERSLVIARPPTPIVSNLCAELTLSMTENGGPAPFPSSGAVTITSDASTKIFATEADCAAGPSVTATGIVDVSAGETTKSFFLRTAAEERVTLTASASFASGELTFDPHVFLGLGQPDPRTVRQRARGTSAPAGLAFHGGRMLLGEPGFSRIRVWDQAPSNAEDPASSVIGEPNASTDTTGRALSSYSYRVSAPAIWTDGTRLVAVDELGHRVLVWTKFPTGAEPPSFVLGQPAGPDNLTAMIANNGGVSASSMSSPLGVTSDGTRLFVSDGLNHRILVWNTFPTSGGQPASFAIGQPAGPTNLSSNTANAGGVSGTTLAIPAQVILVGSKLVAADAANNRVLVFDTIPAAAGQSASFAIGQPAGASNLTTNGAGSTATSMHQPFGLASDGTRLLVTDRANARVLVWSTFPTAGGAPASFALGQPAGPQNLTSSTPDNGGVNGSSLNDPFGVGTDGTKVVVSDVDNHRVLVWNTFPTSGGETASFAIGQPAGASNLTSSGAENVGVDGTTFMPTGAPATDGTHFYMSDWRHRRVLGWNKVPASPMEPASFALGQPAGPNNLTSSGSNNGGPSGASIGALGSPLIAGGKLFVPDSSNHRVLVWNTLPTSAEPASFALGQPAGPNNLTSVSSNVGGVGPSTMYNPTAVATDGTRLFVSDGLNHRVLVWNTIPQSGGQPADYALGQPAGPQNLASGDPNHPAVSGASMNGPIGIRVVGGRLHVVDSLNHRVLVWNTVPTAGGVPADFALGQPAGAANLTTNTGSGTVSASTLLRPGDVDGDATTLYVADRNNNRVLVWSPLPSAGGAPATSVLGQPSFEGAARNGGGAVSNLTLAGPSGLRVEPTRLFISDDFNFRVTIVPR